MVVKNPAVFSRRYPDASPQKILGPCSGCLSNAGEKLERTIPGDLDSAGERWHIRADRVNHDDGSHPTGALNKNFWARE